MGSYSDVKDTKPKFAFLIWAYRWKTKTSYLVLENTRCCHCSSSTLQSTKMNCVVLLLSEMLYTVFYALPFLSSDFFNFLILIFCINIFYRTKQSDLD